MNFWDKFKSNLTLPFTNPLNFPIGTAVSAGRYIGSALGQGLNSLKEKKSATINSVRDSVGDFASSSNINLDSIADAINNSMSSYTSSALAFERESLKNQQDFNARQAELAFQRSQSSAREQMDFQKSERLQAQAYNTLMSNTQYQRAVADLRKAGINPILAVQGLSGSAPTVQAMSGSSASASPASSSKADYTSALKEDKQALNIMIDMLSNSLSLFKLFRR